MVEPKKDPEGYIEYNSDEEKDKKEAEEEKAVSKLEITGTLPEDPFQLIVTTWGNA